MASPGNVEETQPQVENPMVQNAAETFILIGFIPSSSRLLDAVRNKANGAWAIYALGPQGLSLDSRGCQLKGLRASF